MSAFLGPIHHWLFNKIRLFEDLEVSIVNHVAEKYGEKAKEISNTMETEYGSFIPQQPLENLIDTNNIHGWLQNRIQIAETRQAATLKSFIDKYGNAVVSIVEPLFIAQGGKSGEELKEQAGLLTAPDLYKALNNYLLDGMPCDHVNNVVTSEADHLQWRTTRCLHQPYWLQSGMDSTIMYQLRSNWIKAFVENANPSFTYTVEGKGGNEGLLHNIITK
ncbi:hypothetical protein [Alkaliphilus hydrothermalis]|uniref:Uncharacterized protein n=1 Tax=Alkaliphilus hydrothermalis TaxID=1482730 RepID=A0ABS2NT42_9FIRM|nr:hypothetical protein [Alkaliphilus hydrothermalis]MBM7616076.1 hypothetical protein [Alkaliphilus hydrothermalis]